jgi:hypothetical protein
MRNEVGTDNRPVKSLRTRFALVFGGSMHTAPAALAAVFGNTARNPCILMHNFAPYRDTSRRNAIPVLNAERKLPGCIRSMKEDHPCLPPDPFDVDALAGNCIELDCLNAATIGHEERVTGIGSEAGALRLRPGPEQIYEENES